MIESAAGEIKAAPRPCSARDPMSTPSLDANPSSSEAPVKITRPTRNSRFRRAAGETRSQLHKGPGLFRGTIVDAQAEARLEQVTRYGQAHSTQTNKADSFFHRGTLLSA